MPGDAGADRTSVAVVLAAGAGSRFGGLKQVAELDGRPLVRWPAEAALAAGIDEVLVTVGCQAPRVEAALAGLPVRFVHVADWRRGLSASVQAGLAAAGPDRDLLILLGDQPAIGEAAIRRVLEARPGDESAVRATFEGRPSHPVLVRRHALQRIGPLEGDRGLGQILGHMTVRLVPCDDVATDRDVDQAADLAALAATRSASRRSRLREGSPPSSTRS